jgi:3',5'-cyclic AMP phosphodiesterase CpdA
MRVLHFSDIHVASAWREVPWRQWIGKRAIGALNLMAGRGRRFTDNLEKIAALTRFSREQAVDLVLFTGDFTALGLESELAAAREAVEPLMAAPAGFVAIPGNHDIYLQDVLRSASYERHFGDTLRTDLPEHSADGVWPMVRLIDGGPAVVAVNSARPNPLPWRSNGRIPPTQLSALARLLEDVRVRERFVFIMNHYPPRLADGSRDRPIHRMLNDEEFLSVCAELPRGAILCGHVHHRYAVRVAGVRPTILCCGSTTMALREGLWLYELQGPVARAVPGRWTGTQYALEPDAACDL